VLEDVIDLLACPACGAALTAAGGALRCPSGHSFDVARQGYVSLLHGDARPGGDTPAMVAARDAYLGAGHFAPILAAVGAAAGRALAAGPAGGVVDLGAGTGRQLADVLERTPERVGLALDRSPAAARRAARAHPRLGAAVCDVWRGLPVRSAAAALVLNVFAPRNGPEIRRALHPGGRLIVAVPTPRHLGELILPLGLIGVDERKRERMEEALGPHLELVEAEPCEAAMALPHPDLERLVAMGPSAWHADQAALGERIAALPDPAPVTLSVTVATYRPR
jgi:23S rRNA (guanine745-N1)-methyltransferase